MSIFGDAAVEACARKIAQEFGYDHVWESGDEVYGPEFWLHVARTALDAAVTESPQGNWS
jgi:hypothetical protein